MDVQTIQHKQGIQAYSLGFKSQVHVNSEKAICLAMVIDTF